MMMLMLMMMMIVGGGDGNSDDDDADADVDATADEVQKSLFYRKLSIVQNVETVCVICQRVSFRIYVEIDSAIGTTKKKKIY